MSGFSAAISLLGLVVLAVGFVYGVSRLVRVSSERVAVTPFASGLEPGEHAVSRFHVRWYTLAMLFLAFDMEMVFMYPWMWVISVMGPAPSSRCSPSSGSCSPG